MTEVNYAEVQYIIRRKNGDAAWAQIAAELNAGPIHFHPADRALANTAADFKARYQLSLADAFADAPIRSAFSLKAMPSRTSPGNNVNGNRQRYCEQS